jgi:phenylacetate-CoA ligase
MINIYPLLGEKLLVPLYDLARGTSRFKCELELNKTQWFSKKEIETLQQRNMHALLKHAYENVPYYRRIMKSRRILPSDIKSIEDLKKLPVLTKSMIRKNFENLIAQNFPRSELVPYQSGGTGDQIKFFITKKRISWEVAAEYRAYCWAGYRLGQKCLLIWGARADLRKTGKIRSYFSERIERTMVVDAFMLSDETLAKTTELLNKFKPEVIRGYSNSVYMLANYLLKHGVKHHNPKAVITGAETLIDTRRRAMEKAFDCEVFDYYGSREIGAIAAECEAHDGYHVNAENVILEFSKDGETVGAGEDGLVLATGLRNYGMPLIRYNMGDVGRPSNHSCKCGRGLPIMSSIQGRTSEFMAVYDAVVGHIVPIRAAGPGFFGSVLMYLPLERYQIIQETLERIVIKVVKGKGYSQSHTDYLLRYVRKYLGDNIKVEIEFVDYLPPQSSGKRSSFVSKINSFEPDNL